MKQLHELREKACEELKTLNKNQELDAKEWEVVRQLVSIIKKIDEICMLKNVEDGQYDDYGHGSSYANRGQHLVRGHYSHNGRHMPMDDGYSARRDGRGRYSREDGRAEMMGILDRAWDAATPEERDRFSRFLRDM